MSELFTIFPAGAPRCGRQVAAKKVLKYVAKKQWGKLSQRLMFASIVAIAMTPKVASTQEVEAGKATVIIESISNSMASRGKSLAVTYYADEQCSRRGKTDKVFKKNYADDLHTFNPLAVDIDVPFIFQVSYTEKRRNETRSCAAISSISLESDRSYKAVFTIVDEVIGCNIQVFDITDVVAAQALQTGAELAKPEEGALAPEPVVVPDPIQVVDGKPEMTCSRVGREGYKSGTPVYSYKDRLG